MNKIGRVPRKLLSFVDWICEINNLPNDYGPVLYILRSDLYPQRICVDPNAYIVKKAGSLDCPDLLSDIHFKVRSLHFFSYILHPMYPFHGPVWFSQSTHVKDDVRIANARSLLDVSWNCSMLSLLFRFYIS